ncbi:competence type IV pilus major pilin ComGC [uncultured Limosilactobacillus sp.]|uniref:competence type IV pilus major pilin ComGC n=1 Tax=uncultured Limosilactobacillus sp. TaxID=2837629 RepID=UPI0025D51FAD|nr:competence type IV pilus major pilin ComGC [uncultured Limosilactobacillus sp.]
MKKRKAFTLIEMAIVMFIISLLILIVLPNLASQRKRAVKMHGNTMVTVVQTQLDLFENDTGKKATSYDQLVKVHYLTAAQVKKAHDEHIAVNNGQARQE